ncbi:ATP-binding protein [Olleya sp. Bg11-27]|uniref:ATP-binding protein n=1 Tax=Olleya sp. Bg11-27 TaxID=2058135 RepID=UPI000C313829|nr:ATP-binding protein [Olleya sp. Bg11-27]AUC76993.1 histidine kinase [Olleya sp. Bg11-27]
MADKDFSLDQQTFKKLSRLYIIALSAIAVTVIVSQLFVRKYLQDQQTDSTVINIAGRQRMLSQKLTKEVLLISDAAHLEDRIALKNKLKATILLWSASHEALKNGNDSIGLPKTNSANVITMFNRLDPVFNTITTASHHIIQNIETVPELTRQNFTEAIAVIKSEEATYLTIMDEIVNQYDLEADQKVRWLKKLELLLMILTLVILLAEFLFIFWPTAKTVKKSLFKLLQAEKNAKKMAYDADVLSVAKEKSIKELRALTQAMNETLLFARLSSNGTIIQMGSKFSKLLGVNKFNPQANFYEVISRRQSEQLVIGDVISKHKKTGWQGEVKATTQNEEDIWLEMSIVPFNPTGNKSELLIVASDHTKRKGGQLEIERLTKVSFEEKMNQQKIISSKIIENQEKEQNRIAKDVHDGIGQMLTGLKYNLESIDVSDIEKTSSKIEHLKLQAADIIKGIRTATFNLTPPELTDHGVVPAITKLTKELAKLTGKNIVLVSKVNFNQRLDSLVEINIYRITQEAINNAIKYAESTHIIVSITKTEKILSIVIDDNGKGFDPEKVKNKKNGDGGMGLTFMRERINYIDGRLFISSEIGKGMRVTLNVPL